MKNMLSKLEWDTVEAYCRDFKDITTIARERFRAPTTVQTYLLRARLKVKAINNRHLVALYWQWRTAGDREYQSWSAHA